MSLSNFFTFFKYYNDFTPYNYYELSIQKWCQNNYQIHGLWPQYNSDSYPINCIGPSYTDITNTDLLNDMYRDWSNCDDSTQSFWNHEWTKHGTCVYQQFGITENQYFQIAINLFDQLTTDDFNKCNNQDDCIVACYNLDLYKINCP